MGIEPTPSAWKAEVLPLNYTRRGGGGGRIRTYEGISQQIYSLPPLAAWVPLRGHKSRAFSSSGYGVSTASWHDFGPSAPQRSLKSDPATPIQEAEHEICPI
jgi:hypothetical protein